MVWLDGKLDLSGGLYGTNGRTAGEGGDLSVSSDGDLLFRADLDVQNGVSSALGSPVLRTAQVALSSDQGTVFVGTPLDVSGTPGVVAGAGGEVTLYGGQVLVSANIDASGARADAGCVADCDGGDGGVVTLESSGGDVGVAGDLDVRGGAGGAAASAHGGRGGALEVAALPGTRGSFVQVDPQRLHPRLRQLLGERGFGPRGRWRGWQPQHVCVPRRGPVGGDPGLRARVDRRPRWGRRHFCWRRRSVLRGPCPGGRLRQRPPSPAVAL